MSYTTALGLITVKHMYTSYIIREKNDYLRK